MDKLGKLGFFLLAVIAGVIAATVQFGIQVLIGVAVGAAALALVGLFSMFFEAGTGHSPFGYIKHKLFK
jgi:hypothetical protein